MILRRFDFRSLERKWKHFYKYLQRFLSKPQKIRSFFLGLKQPCFSWEHGLCLQCMYTRVSHFLFLYFVASKQNEAKQKPFPKLKKYVSLCFASIFLLRFVSLFGTDFFASFRFILFPSNVSFLVRNQIYASFNGDEQGISCCK